MYRHANFDTVKKYKKKTLYRYIFSLFPFPFHHWSICFIFHTFLFPRISVQYKGCCTIYIVQYTHTGSTDYYRKSVLKGTWNMLLRRCSTDLRYYMKRMVDVISILAVGFLWDFGTGHSVLSSIRLQPVCPGQQMMHRYLKIRVGKNPGFSEKDPTHLSFMVF